MKIRATPQTIWKRPAYLPYVQSALNEETLAAAEKQLGHSLPAELVEILKVQNGGPIRFKLPESVGDTIAGIGDQFPSLLDRILNDAQEYVDFSLEGLIPFDGDGHWYNCLDFRGDPRNPGVSYIDVECNSEHRIANSFAEYLNLLELDIDRELVLRNVKDFDDARHRLQSIFGVPPEEKISNVGVPYTKYQIGNDWRVCCWISSNRVAAGYSGDSPESFIFRGEAALFPELTENAVIFECPEGQLRSYRQLLHAHDMELVTIEQAANVE
ncbi:SMI1/KNR4 family protein [Pirellulaceae bacterium SH449]